MRKVFLFMTVSFDGNHNVSSGDMHWLRAKDGFTALTAQQTTCPGGPGSKTVQNVKGPGRSTFYLSPAYELNKEQFMKANKSHQQESDLPVELAQPARRALSGAGIQTLVQLTRFSEAEIQQLHGIGPNGLSQLRGALAGKVLSLADKR
jgi:hypothetical protein